MVPDLSAPGDDTESLLRAPRGLWAIINVTGDIPLGVMQIFAKLLRLP